VSAWSDEVLARRFELRVERFQHGTVRLDVLLPRSADELIDPSEFDRDERLPYWAELWPSARALARYLVENPPPTATRILELGCGIALPSLALAAAGYPVLATDYYADALLFARANAERNHIDILEVATLDWRHPTDLPRAELVLAADVLYERRNADALANLLPRLLAPGGSLLLADPGRSYLGEFLGRLEDAGWSCTTLVERKEESDPATGAISRVRIFRSSPPLSPVADCGSAARSEGPSPAA
jgi:predicted nicotinamide N-methyase